MSTHGGTDPGTETADYDTALSQYVTNSPVSGGAGTQYVCTAGTVLSNAFTQVNPTNITLTLTNDATLTWQWQTQYLWTVHIAPPGGGSVEPLSRWYDAGASFIATAQVNVGWVFTNWSGDLTGFDPELPVTMNGPVTVTSHFESAAYSVTLATDPSGLDVFADGETNEAPYSFSWEHGTVHSIGVESPQLKAAGERCLFGSWSDGGARVHDVTITQASNLTASSRPSTGWPRRPTAAAA